MVVVSYCYGLMSIRWPKMYKYILFLPTQYVMSLFFNFSFNNMLCSLSSGVEALILL
jgi:hypothetical protein